MLFSFKYPPEAEKRIRTECRLTGEPLDEAIANKPKLFFGLALYLNAWHELDGERDRNELERIKRSSVFQYGEDYELTKEQTQDLWFYVRQMDSEFLQWYKTRLPKK